MANSEWDFGSQVASAYQVLPASTLRSTPRKVLAYATPDADGSKMIGPRRLVSDRRDQFAPLSTDSKTCVDQAKRCRESNGSTTRPNAFNPVSPTLAGAHVAPPLLLLKMPGGPPAYTVEEERGSMVTKSIEAPNPSPRLTHASSPIFLYTAPLTTV